MLMRLAIYRPNTSRDAGLGDMTPCRGSDLHGLDGSGDRPSWRAHGPRRGHSPMWVEAVYYVVVKMTGRGAPALIRALWMARAPTLRRPRA